MSVYCACCVFSGRSLSYRSISCSKQSYWLWCVIVCDLEISRMRQLWPTLGCCAIKRNVHMLTYCDALFYQQQYTIVLMYNVFNKLFVVLLVSESSAALTTPLPITTSVVTTSSTTMPPPPRLCGPLELEYCNKLPYNVTSYPNKLGHRSIKEVRDDVIAFR